MTGAPITDVTCGVFRKLPDDALADGAVHRFVVGQDTRLVEMTADEARAELGDPFATLLLLQGTFPVTAGDVLEALDAATPAGDPLRERLFFLVGEGSQVAFTPDTASVQRNLRFLVATRPVGDDGPDLMISSFHPDTTDVELMAWDRAAGGFNYYRTAGRSSGWVFAGNSRHALLPDTEGKGPFESHPSGNVVMKELRAPWLHWHSPDAPVTDAVFAADDPLRDHPWFDGLEELGAVTCERAVVRPSIRRWTRKRFESLVGAGAVDRPERIMRQLLDTPTVNLITSHSESNPVAPSESIDLPQTFFVDSEALTELLGLEQPPTFAVSRATYDSSVAQFGFRMSDGEDFERPGDTHFAFAVPERAFEDQATLAEAVRVGLVSERLAACLLMVDFPNPVFSLRRRMLLDHVPESATLAGGASGLSEEMAQRILAAAESAGEDSPEQEFESLWEVGEDFKGAFDALLTAYYAAVASRLATQEGFDAYVRLAESRRARVREMPISESPLLFAQTDIAPAERAMLRDGTVAEA